MAKTDAITANPNSFVPVIDIAPYLAGTPDERNVAAAEQLGRACREVGFYVIVGHGVDPATGRSRSKPCRANSSICRSMKR